MKERAAPIRCMARDERMLTDLQWRGPDCERLKYIYWWEWQFIYSS